MKVLFLVLLAALPAAPLNSPGCDRYQAPRAMSTAIVNAEKAQLESLKKQIEVEDNFIEDVVFINTVRADELTRDIQTKLVKLAQIQLDKDPNLSAEQKTAILISLAKRSAEDSALNEQQKRHVQEMIGKLKAKHQELLATQQIIVGAIEELDQWVQLNKFDELVFARIADKFRNGLEKLSGVTKDVTDILLDLHNSMPKPSPSPAS